jgi:hypothetical protein
VTIESRKLGRLSNRMVRSDRCRALDLRDGGADAQSRRPRAALDAPCRLR